MQNVLVGVEPAGTSSTAYFVTQSTAFIFYQNMIILTLFVHQMNGK